MYVSYIVVLRRVLQSYRLLCSLFFFFFKQKTAYEMRISDWSSDVCSSDLLADWPQPDMGPLGGVAGALRHAASEGFDQLLTAPVDCLRLPPDLRALLEPAPAFLDTQPVIGLWPAAP